MDILNLGMVFNPQVRPMGGTPQPSFSNATLEELAHILCSLFPTTDLFVKVLDDFSSSLKSPPPPFDNAYCSTSSRSSLLHRHVSPIETSYDNLRTLTDYSLVHRVLTTLAATPSAVPKFIQFVFSPRKFIKAPEELKRYIAQFNIILSYDGWCIQVESDGSIGFRSVKPDISPFLTTTESSTDWKEEIEMVSFVGLSGDPALIETLNYRLRELQKCLENDLALASIILSGSILEGVLRALAEMHPKAFNIASSCPKKDNRVLPFREWSFASLINVAAEVGFLNEGSKKFNQTLRDFRNYVHPYEQIAQHFRPDIGTARLCFQTMKESILHIQRKLNSHT